MLHPSTALSLVMQQLNVITLCAHVRYVILVSISIGTDFRKPVYLKGYVHAMEYVINTYLSAIFSGWWRPSVGVISKCLLMCKRPINVALVGYQIEYTNDISVHLFQCRIWHRFTGISKFKKVNLMARYGITELTW